MKQYWTAFVMCQSMFCAIPCPFKAWDEKARGLQLLFLPVIGLEIGVLWGLVAWLAFHYTWPAMIKGIALCALPFLTTGFLHLDGFMDVSDAVKSWRSLKRRREILKDSLVGAFSVISVVLLILTQFAFCASVPNDANPWALIWIPLISRCCAGMAVSGLPPMETSQYADLNQKKKLHIAVFILLFLFASLLCIFLCGKYILTIAGCALGYGMALGRAYKSLEGMNGDISGYALTIGELCGLAVYALI